MPARSGSSPTRERIATPFQPARRGGRPRSRGRRARGEQLVEGVVGELGLLQADDVRAALVEPGQQPRQPLLDRVDVPGRHSHRPTVPAPRRAEREPELEKRWGDPSTSSGPR